MSNHKSARQEATADIYILVQSEPFDLSEEMHQLQLSMERRHEEVGAISSFTGQVRSAIQDQSPSQNSGKLLALSIEHYPGMTEKSLLETCQLASTRWPIKACRVLHRVGYLTVGQPIVLVLVAASHREQAIKACEFIIDHLKTAAPFWKKAVYENTAEWIEAKSSDQLAIKKWQGQHRH